MTDARRSNDALADELDGPRFLLALLPAEDSTYAIELATECADALREPAITVTDAESREIVKPLRDYANMECSGIPHAYATDPEDEVKGCEHCVLHNIADAIEAAMKARKP